MYRAELADGNDTCHTENSYFYVYLNDQLAYARMEKHTAVTLTES